MKQTFKTNLIVGVGISLLLLIISSVASYFSISNLIGSADKVDHTNKVITISEEIISNLKDGERGQRGYLLTKDPEFLEPYVGSYERTMAALNQTRQLTRDSPVQQANCDSLEKMINDRFSYLNQSVEIVRAGKEVSIDFLKPGREKMMAAVSFVNKIKSIEEGMMTERRKKYETYNTYTPIIIVVASVLALLITFFFFRRVLGDFNQKTLLTDSLQQKDKEIAERLRIIQNIAQEVANGNYIVRVSEEENDSLGVLSGSLNKMAASLDHSFNQLSKNEWLQSGLAKLNEQVVGEKEISKLCDEVIREVVEYTNSQMGAVYLSDGHDALELKATYALNNSALKKKINENEGIAGRCFKEKKQIMINDIDEKLYASFSGGELKPRHIVAFPVLFEGQTAGVIEIGTIHTFQDKDIEYLKNISEVIGIAINTATNRARVKELLEETQSQSEELQSQHRELENINVELEAQSEKLQTSEEELKVQQEELMEANQVLKERSVLLEERNHLIAIRNLDIQKKAEELELSTRYKSEFLANMSHELRTPLNSILLLARLLSENTNKNLTKEQIEFAQVIQSSGNGLLQLIDEILDLSKIESGKVDLSYEKVRLSEIANTWKLLFNPIAKEKNINFNITIKDKVPSEIETDRQRLDQVIKNLISNALKFTAKGSIDVIIAPSKRYDGYIDFSVRDSGIGVPLDKQEAIFEAFKQADGSTKRNYGGTGLGLSISRQLAKLLSGDIILLSEPGKGSEFTLTIPATKSMTANAGINDKLSKPAADSHLPASQQNANRFIANKIPAEIPDDRNNIKKDDKLLLIVEDDIGFAKALLDFVRQNGYKGIVVVRGDQVQSFAKEYKPVGILLDVQLPVKDGLQVLDEIKSDPYLKHIPVHVMSSFELKKETIGKGAVDFINKPMIADQMGSILKRIESAMQHDKNKVLIVEDNTQHAKALSYFLSEHGINTEMTGDISESIQALTKKEMNCVVFDMGLPGEKSYDALEIIRNNEKLADIPIIIFTGKSLSRSEEQRIRQYADSVIIKTAYSYQRILDEVSLFLHLMDESIQRREVRPSKFVSLENILKNKTVLITDDDLRNIYALSKALELHQMNVVTASNGKEALEVLQSNPSVHIVLMDMMMPEMDGYETIQQIRNNTSWKKLPVIAVTAKAMLGDREKCIQAGASDYITKPVDTDQLVSLMRIWLQEVRK